MRPGARDTLGVFVNILVRPGAQTRADPLPPGLESTTELSLVEHVVDHGMPATRWEYRGRLDAGGLSHWVLPMMPSSDSLRGAEYTGHLTLDDDANLLAADVIVARGTGRTISFRVENTFDADSTNLGVVVAPDPSQVVDSSTVSVSPSSRG